MSVNNKRYENPRFTVLIPTKDRADYLYHTLRTCMAQDYDNLEIIVSDDGSSDRTMDVVLDAASKDSRIKYHNNELGVGMRDNFEYALGLAKPGYVIALGSDDGLLPNGIVGMLDALRASEMNMLSWAAPLYTYPGVNDDRGQLMLYHPKKDKIINSSEFLARQVSHLNYLGDIESPMFYVKGVVSTELIQRVKERTKDGRFYSCPTPDGYSGIVLAGEVAQYAFSGKPFSIYGLSPKSQGLGYLSNNESAKKNSKAFYKSVETIPMHMDLAGQPYSPLITLMTVDYLLTAKSLPGWSGTVPPIDYKKVIAYSVSELSHGLYGADRLPRELETLRRIAVHHNLENYFNQIVIKTRRWKEKSPFKGSGINPSAIFLDAKSYEISNIFNASFASCYLQKFYSDLMPTRIYNTIERSLRYFFSSRGKGDFFPKVE
ncbi:MAG: glycosyltransferase family A protein [Cellvibrio sp.]|uniref:glycosyltransferase family 2 protein n=1 Tax=Cellvibrio sp. TaxID=1965322 RepID=UPI0027186C83|nr:glycosyltransferase family A protein [Cellvibrio sp.]